MKTINLYPGGCYGWLTTIGIIHYWRNEMRLIELDRSSLHDDLTFYFMQVIYKHDHPNEFVDSEQLTDLYQNDPVFTAKVRSITASTMQVFLGYLDEQENRIAAILARNGIDKLVY